MQFNMDIWRPSWIDLIKKSSPRVPKWHPAVLQYIHTKYMKTIKKRCLDAKTRFFGFPLDYYQFCTIFAYLLFHIR
ncbi:MAG: hypothetical protein ABW185_27105, partial [Sedimenticola sp.]